MPTTTGVATSFIDFTRASNATVTDSDGRVKWAPHNLLLASEQFNASAWNSTSGVTVTANSTSAPNSATTSDTLAFTTAGYHYQTLSIGSAVTNTTYTMGVWLWSTTGKTQIVMRLHGQATSTDQTVQAVTLTSTPTLFTISRTFTSTDTAIVAGLDNRTVAGGDGIAGNVIAWGAHLYRSDLGGMQPNTSAYPMYNPTTPKNLAGFTEDFSGTGWTRVNLLANGSGSVANAVVNPVNGLQTADLIVESTANGYHSLYRSFTSVANTPYLWSAYVKSAGRTIVQIAAQATGNVHIVEFNLTGSGTATTRSGSGTAAITALSDGWYRISTIATATGSGTAYWQVDLCNAANTNSYTGDGTSGIYLWGAQISDSASLDSYVPVYGAAVTSAAYYGPRRDFDPVTLACKGLLVEEQRVNNIVGSANFSGGGTGWVLDGASLTASATAGPDGSLSATSIVQGTGNNRTYQFDNSSVTGSKVFSIYVKPNAGSSLSISAIGGMSPNGPAVINATTGAVTGFTGASSVAVGNGWYRVFLPVTVTVASGSGTYWLISGPASSVFIWGAQLEAGSFPTSYIPTGAATATRNADVASVSTQAFPYSGTEGTLVVNATPMVLGGIAYALSDGTASNRIQAQTQASNYHFYIDAGGVLQVNLSPGTLTANTISKLAGTYKVNDFAASDNGSAVATDTSGSVPVCSKLDLGHLNSSGYLNGHIRQITYLPRRISNTELQTRTA